jgi:hypothetical protein
MELEDIMGKKMLHSTYRPDNSKETKTHKFRPEVFLFQNENLLDAFNFYYSRHKNAEAKNQK